MPVVVARTASRQAYLVKCHLRVGLEETTGHLSVAARLYTVVVDSNSAPFDYPHDRRRWI